MLRALRRLAAALALAAFLSVGTAAVLTADEAAERAVPRGQTGGSPGSVPRLSPGPVSKRYAPVRWRRSLSLGTQWRGQLVDGVQLPAEGRMFFTWDPILRRAPNRGWRRWGNDRLVRTLLQVLDAYSEAHLKAARVGVGDLSRPHGGDFGPRYGLPGHVSHQNGLDVDVYYPRLDGRERAPARPGQIDNVLAQDLVDRFVAAGAIRVFVGPHTGVVGPPRIVQRLTHHDNHLHVRL